MIIIGQVLIAILTIVGPWLVLSLAQIRNYTLQIFFILVIAFVFFLRAKRKQKVSYKTDEVTTWSSLKDSIQIALVGMAVLLMVGNTGGFGSWVLPLIFVYYFFHVLANNLFINLLTLGLNLIFIYFFTSEFSEVHYGAVLSLIIFAPIAIFAQKYYIKAIKDNWQLELEREKVTYYNLYAEKQQNELLKRKSKTTISDGHLSDFISDLIPQIDNLQKESRFPQNQLVISAQLTKIGLALRQALKKG